MDAEAEREVLLGVLAVDVELIARREGAVVAVGRAEQQQHLRPGGQIDVGDPGIALHQAPPGEDRWPEAQQLLDGGRDTAWVAAEVFPLCAVGEQLLQAIRQQVRGSLVAGGELAVAERDNLVLADRLITLLVEPHQFAGEVVAADGQSGRRSVARSTANI